MRDLIWKVKLSADRSTVFERLATDRGRESFWAERSHETPQGFDLTFPNGEKTSVIVVANVAPQRLEFLYFGASTMFALEATNRGTVLTLSAKVPDDDLVESSAGWISVLLALKARVDGDVDLRNHDQGYSWDFGFVDN